MSRRSTTTPSIRARPGRARTGTGGRRISPGSWRRASARTWACSTSASSPAARSPSRRGRSGSPCSPPAPTSTTRCAAPPPCAPRSAPQYGTPAQVALRFALGNHDLSTPHHRRRRRARPRRGVGGGGGGAAAEGGGRQARAAVGDGFQRCPDFRGLTDGLRGLELHYSACIIMQWIVSMAGPKTKPKSRDTHGGRRPLPTPLPPRFGGLVRWCGSRAPSAA